MSTSTSIDTEATKECDSPGYYDRPGQDIPLFPFHPISNPGFQFSAYLNSSRCDELLNHKNLSEINIKEENIGKFHYESDLSQEEPPWTALEDSLLSTLTFFLTTQFHSRIPQIQPAIKLHIKEIPWPSIAAYLLPPPSDHLPRTGHRRSPNSCRRRWKSLFPDSSFHKTAYGLYLLKDDSLSANCSDDSDNMKPVHTRPLPGRRYRKDWTQEELEKIHELQQRYGNKWTFIASEMGTRSVNEVKNYWHQLHRKSRRKN